MMRSHISGAAALCALALIGPWSGRAEAQVPGAAVAAEHTIRVSGFGEVEVRPDLAEVAFAVETFADSAREAGRLNAARMDRVIAALVAAGVPRSEIETRNYSVHPEYVHEEGRREPRLRGYRAMNQMVLETTRLERVGDYIDIALGAGANRMDGISFRLRDPSPPQAEALREAVTRARASAEAIASALGVRLGPVLDASTNADPIRPMYARQESAMRDFAGVGVSAPPPPPTPIQPTEQTVSAFVQLVFGIRQ